ncbi:MAG: NAD(P)-binding protein [Xanthomonadales bacterium]|nr:NAD(P)-binding protein [Xanthomonadales bacterium]
MKRQRATDRELGLDRAISRRQFCQGSAVALGASLLPWERAWGFDGSPEIGAGYYPPGRDGLRGSHPGSFETAHALAHGGARWETGEVSGEGEFDLVVVGAGISGLAAAWFYRRENPGARILLLDNHEDFGGHAIRNEFTIDGRTIIGYGGSQSIDTPSSYSPEAIGLLRELAIDLQVFHQAFDRDFYRDLGLGEAFWLDAATFGVDRLVKGNALYRHAARSADETARFAAEIATNTRDRETLLGILNNDRDFLAGKSPAEKVAYLRTLSYDECLRRHFGASEYLVKLFNPLTKSYWGIGTDGISAREAMFLSMPGFNGLGIDLARDDPHYGLEKNEPYIFHFPDGNAGIARLLVRSLVPAAAPGDSMQDQVTACFDYSALDRADSPVRIRLNSTVVRIAHDGPSPGKGVGLRYVKQGRAWDVRARQVVYAGYSAMLPYIAPEFPPEQAAAFGKLVKVPLLYANTLLSNWRAFEKLGVSSLRFPGGTFTAASLDFPVSMGAYAFSQDPSEPIIVHLVHVPARPGEGLDARQQNRDGRRQMLSTSFADYERAIRGQLGDALAGGGFDPARDIRGLTVNRWPHGYAYEYNDLWDPPDWNRYKGPHIQARKPFGRVAIANSDAEAYAYVNGAIDAAWRAVGELAQ